MLKPIVIATAIAGTLDILFAMILTLWFGREIGDMLRFVASGPFPDATDTGTGSSRRPHLLDMPYRSGIAYGVITYFVMNWVVVPLRFGTPLPPKTLSIVTQGFAHIVLVGIPIALVTARHLRPRLA
jgi:hypothetical protein